MLTNDECMSKLKKWIIRGIPIAEDDPGGQHVHVHGIDARSLDISGVEDWDAELAAAQAALAAGQVAAA